MLKPLIHFNAKYGNNEYHQYFTFSQILSYNNKFFFFFIFSLNWNNKVVILKGAQPSSWIIDHDDNHLYPKVHKT